MDVSAQQDHIVAEQIELERESVAAGVLRYWQMTADAETRGDGASLKPAERWLHHWFAHLEREIRNLQRRMRREHVLGSAVGGPPILLLNADRLAVVTMHETLGACLANPKGISFAKLSYAIGRATIAEACLDIMAENHAEQLEKLTKKYRDLAPGRVNWWAKKTLTDPFWSCKVCNRAGADLFWTLSGIALANDYDDPEPDVAFRIEKRREGKKTKSYVVMSPTVARAIESSHEARSTLRPRYMPMIVEPGKWIQRKDEPWTDGGYMQIRTPLVSKATRSQRETIRTADMTLTLKAIGVFNSAAWRIHPKILAAQAQLLKEGGGVANLPRSEDETKPQVPADFETNADSKKAWKREAAKTHDRNAQRRSDMIGVVQKHGVARRLLGRDAIYFPHQCDFRSRTYPQPVPLNHQGDDVCRGLLEIAHGKNADGERAHRWLKIHAANCYGMDKVPFEDRIAWTNDHTKQIVECAADPCNTEFWHKADGGYQPWQFLAACIALTDPEHGARLPIGIDGTCNGLQHYAALARDRTVGELVNMCAVPESTGPRDIYTKVADTARPIVAVDAAKGLPEAMDVLDHVVRKVCKPPVMTTYYGVTLFGARGQIKDGLEKRGLEGDRLYKARTYLAGVVMGVIDTLCASARALMTWITECASLIADRNRLVTWTAPLGFPVEQPYRHRRKVRIETLSQTLTLRVDDESLPVAYKKHCDAAAPNFVHSVDSAHAQSAGMVCDLYNIFFAHTHDKYVTHAADGDWLGRITRESFVKLHRRDLIGELWSEWCALHPDIAFPEPPARGTWDVSEVLDAPYFFS